MIFIVVIVILLFKQKTAYEMRISDWSSDVCSSDLHEPTPGIGPVGAQRHRGRNIERADDFPRRADLDPATEPGADERIVHEKQQIGRASCRERVCQYV